MHKLIVFLTLITVTVSSQAATLIDSKTNNGGFAVTQTDIDNGLVYAIKSETDLTIDLSRHRVFNIDEIEIGYGVKVAGWSVLRQDYYRANPAIGVDGKFGFAWDGQSGQAFVNSGSMDVVSDTIAYDFSVGDEISLSCSIGSDADHTTYLVDTDVYLIFDKGLATESTCFFAAFSGRMNGSGTSSGTYTLTHSAKSVELFFSDVTAGSYGRRALLDNVNMTVTPEPMTIAMLGFGALGLLRRRK